MPTALIVSRYFPPLSSAGASIRLVKLMKYAAKKGWSFSILTQDPDRPVIAENRLCKFLLDEIPDGTEITRVGNPFFGETLGARAGRILVKDSSLPWGVSVAWRGWEKCRQSKPDLIFVNSPPFTNVAIGILLASLFGIPIVLDMKDDWVGSPAFRKKGKLRRIVESWIEKKTMQKASAVLTVTPSSCQALIQRYSAFGMAKNFFYIPNGQDLEEYRILWNRKRKTEGHKFRLLSAAVGYRPDYRDLTPFLKAVELFLQRYPQGRNEIEIEFLGEEPYHEYKTWLESLLPQSALNFRGVLNRRLLVEQLWKADMFFLVQPRENFTAISGTLYEYWVTGKAPVLLFSETGSSSSLVFENQLGEHFLFDQVEEASNYLERIFRAFRAHNPVWIERTGVEEYDRQKTVEKMIKIWSSLIDGTEK